MEETQSIVCVKGERQCKDHYDFYVIENDDTRCCMRKISSMSGAGLPDLFGWAYLYPHIYVVGGKFAEVVGRPLNDVYSFDTTSCSATSKWEKRVAMNASRVCPVLAPLPKRNRLYAFGGNSSPDHFAEYYDCHSHQWTSLPEPPPWVLERKDALGYAVVDNENCIILWNSCLFFCLNLGSESDIPNWELHQNLQLPPFRFGSTVAILNDILYWYCLDSLYAYDLAANRSFSGPVYKIDYTDLEAQHCYHHYYAPHHFLVATKEDELCFIWYNPERHGTGLDVSFVKLGVQRCDQDGILLHLNCSANFNISDSHFIHGALGSVKFQNSAHGKIYFSRDDADAPNSGIGESVFIPFMFQEKGLRKVSPVISSSPNAAPISLLQNLSQTMYEYAVDCSARVSESRKRRKTNTSSREIPTQKDDRSVDRLLISLGLENYLYKFQEEKIDFDALKILNDEDYEELAIPEDAKNKILEALSESEGMVM